MKSAGDRGLSPVGWGPSLEQPATGQGRAEAVLGGGRGMAAAQIEVSGRHWPPSRFRSARLPRVKD